MTSRALKAGLIVVQIAALAIAIGAAALVFLYWRMGQAPVSLGLFRPSVEAAIERRLPDGYQASIEAIDIRRIAAEGAIQIDVAGLRVLNADDVSAAEAPLVTFSFSLRDALLGKAVPRTARVQGAKFRIIRKRDLSVEIPVAKPESRNRRRSPLSALIDGAFLDSAFQSAQMEGAQITFYDVASGRAWSAPDAGVSLTRTTTGLTARIAGEIDMHGTRAGIDAQAEYRESEGVIDVAVSGANFPVGDLLSTFYGDDAAFLDAPVSGEAVISFTAEGDVRASRFDAEVGDGALVIGGLRREISRIAWIMAFDPMRNRFAIEQLSFDVEGAKGEIAGGVSISFGEDIRQPERVSFDLSSDEIEIAAPEWLEEPLTFTGNRLSGQYQLRNQMLIVETLDLSVEGLSATGFFSLELPSAANGARPPSPGVIADLAFQGGLDPQRLLNIWPKKNIAMGARDWVADRLISADIDSLKFNMDLPPGAVGEDGALPDDAMTLTFDARNVAAHYVTGMTPLTGGAGSGELRGNSFRLNVKRAQVGDVAISKGEVVFPEFIPKWRPTYYRFTAKGEAEAMLGVLDQEPLLLLSKVDLSPEQFSGKVSADIEVMRPNKRDVDIREYGYKGKATFEAMNIAELVGDVQFSEASGTIDLETRSMTVRAKALLADDAPIDLTWRQNFYQEDGPSQIAMSGVFDSSTGDLFGVSARQFVRGPVRFDARATGDLGAFQSLDVDTDFAEAAMSIDMFGWRKPANEPASGSLKMRFAEDGVYVDALTIHGENSADIDGALFFDASGALQSANFKRFSLADAAELAITAKRDAPGLLVFTAVGPFLNAGAMIEQLFEGPDGKSADGGVWGPGVALTARIDEVAMRNGVTYVDAALDMRRDAQTLQALDFTAFAENGAPLKATLSYTGAETGPQRAVEAETSEIGALLSGVFGLNSIEGGEGIVRMVLDPYGAPGVSGELEARDLHVVNAPLLARILSAGSLDGLANLLNGEGIDFDYAAGEFDYADGMLTIDDMQARGSSVGITADGDISFGAGGRARLNGAVAPVYQLNSALGAAPIIGDILVGKQGEGIVAFSYSVGGETANPTVIVNPLSALTPGIFRRLMQPQTQQQNRPQTQPAPEIAPTPAPENAVPVDE